MSGSEMVPMPDLYRCACGKMWDMQKVRAANSPHVDKSLWTFRGRANGTGYLIECPECLDGELPEEESDPTCIVCGAEVTDFDALRPLCAQHG